jgi:5'-3' exonuclease
MRVMVADGNNLAIASASVTGHLVNGTLYGFCNTIIALMRDCIFDYDPEGTFIIAWDSRENWRNILYPEYKANRRVDDDNQEKKAFFEKFREQRKRIITLLELFPVQQLWVKGFEADDIAGHICSQRENADTKTTLVSNDDDWSQLVSERVTHLLPKKGRKLQSGNFQEHMGLKNGLEFTKYKALVGDAGDNVPGADGIGDVSARNYLNGITIRGDRLKTIENWKKNPNGYARSYELVDLHGVRTEKYGFKYEYQKTVGRYDPEALRARFRHYAFESILKKFDARTKIMEKYALGLNSIDYLL